MYWYYERKLMRDFCVIKLDLQVHSIFMVFSFNHVHEKVFKCIVYLKTNLTVFCILYIQHTCNASISIKKNKWKEK